MIGLSLGLWNLDPYGRSSSQGKMLLGTMTCPAPSSPCPLLVQVYKDMQSQQPFLSTMDGNLQTHEQNKSLFTEAVPVVLLVTGIIRQMQDYLF